MKGKFLAIINDLQLLSPELHEHYEVTWIVNVSLFHTRVQPLFHNGMHV